MRSKEGKYSDENLKIKSYWLSNPFGPGFSVCYKNWSDYNMKPLNSSHLQIKPQNSFQKKHIQEKKILSDINSINFITKERKRPEQGGKTGKSSIICEKLLKLSAKLITSTVSTEKVEHNNSKIPSSNDCWKSPKTHAPQWEDASVLTKMPLGHGLWGAKWDSGHRGYYTERSACSSFLFHLPPENPCYRKKRRFWLHCCIFLWSRMHGDLYWDSTNPVYSQGVTVHIRAGVPFENHSSSSSTKTSWWSTTCPLILV